MTKLFLLLFLFYCSHVSGQPGFVQEYNHGNTYLVANSVTENIDGTFYIAGTYDTILVGAPGLWGFIKKTSSAGVELWTRYYTFPGTFGVDFKKIIALADGNLLAAGTIDFGFGVGPTFIDGLICKLDTSGNIIWTKWYGGAGTDAVKDVREMPNGDLHLLFSYGHEDNLFIYNAYQLIITNSNGDSIWSKEYYRNDMLEQFPASFCQTSDGGFALGGDITNFNATANGFIIKTDNAGDTLWTTTFFPNTNSSIVKVLPGNGYLITIGNLQTGQSTWSPQITNYSLSGALNWQLTLNDTNSTVFSAVQSPDGGFALLCSRADSTGDRNILIKIDSLGVKMWETEIPLTSLYLPAEISATSDSSFILTGYTNSLAANGVYLSKISGTGSTTAISAEENENDIYISPNPAKNQITVRIKKPEVTTRSTLFIYDSKGQRVITTPIQFNEPFIIDISRLSHGCYFVSINETDTMRSNCVKFIKE
ncbi:MAG: T9SS type A sorting domain-containing protein [Bacteroidia bacterium]